MSHLKKQFEIETGVCAVNDNFEIVIEYVEWLEAKVEKFNSALHQPTRQGGEFTEICPNAIEVPVVVQDRPNEKVVFVACRTSGKLFPRKTV